MNRLRSIFEQYWPVALRRKWAVWASVSWSASQRRRIADLIGVDTLDQGRTPVGKDHCFWTKKAAEEFAVAARLEFERVHVPSDPPVEVEVARRFSWLP